MKIQHLAVLTLCLVGLSCATPARAQYHGGYPGGYHGGYVNYGYHPYHGGYGYHPYGCYGGGFCGINNTVGILFGAASIVNAIGYAVAVNNNQPWNGPMQQAPERAPAQAPTHVASQTPVTHTTSSSNQSSKSLPHGSITDQGTIRSPWSNSQVPASNVPSGTVLFDAFSGQRYLAP